MRRVVLTSSVAAMVHSVLGKPPGHVITEAEWNTESTLWDQPYALSKMLVRCHVAQLLRPLGGFGASWRCARLAARLLCRSAGGEEGVGDRQRAAAVGPGEGSTQQCA